jgi:hypothetical protein
VSNKNKIEWVEGAHIDEDNLVSVEEWARGICRGVTVAEAAEDLHVEPSLTAVIDALTRSLPASTRERAAEICRAGLSK